MKRSFLSVGATGCATAIWLVKTIVGGFLYATAAFLTKEGWERWKSKNGQGD